MSSTNVFCRRKRNLLRTFGPRRGHEKEFAVSSSSQIAVVSLITKPNHELQKSDTSYCWHSHHKKSATTPLKEKIESYTRETKIPSPGDVKSETPSKRSTDCSGDACRYPISPFRMHPVMVTRTSQISCDDSKTSAARRSSMNNSRSSEITNGTRRYTTNSMQFRHTADRLRLLDSSDHSSEKDVALLETSNVAMPMPSNAVQRELVAKRTSPTNAVNNHAQPASTAEINDKVVQMMAAINALKPSTPIRSATESRRSAQVAQSKGLNRLLGRIYSKSASPESESSKKRGKLGRGDIIITLQRSASQPERNRPAISSREIRLNEDQNLCRDKVQQLMGVEGFRKPSLANCPSYGHFIIVGRAPEEDQQQMAESIREPSCLDACWSPTNPFDTEEDFECDLDQGILHASPAGSSTPRVRIRRSSDHISNDSIQNASGQVAKIVRISRSHKSNEVIRQLEFRTGPDNYGRSPRERLMPSEETENAKKHPSPSKRDLEELEEAFRQYGLPSSPCENGHVDELAASPTVLFLRQRN